VNPAASAPGQSDLIIQPEPGLWFPLSLLIIAALFIWNRRLKNQNQKKSDTLLKKVKKITDGLNRLQENENQYSSMMENSKDAIIIYQDSIVCYANPAACILSGYSKRELTDNKISNVVSPEYENLIIKNFSSRQSGETVPEAYDIEIIKKDGSSRFVEINPSVINYKKAPATLIILRDRTRQKESEFRMASLSDCFLSFEHDPERNINSIVALCGELLGATRAIYIHLEDEQLFSLGKWQVPPDLNHETGLNGNICFDIIKKKCEEIVVIHDLQKTDYYAEDPVVSTGNMATFVGQAVKSENKYIGCLGLFFQKEFIPTEDDNKIMGILKSAIGVEEERMRVALVLQKNEERYRSVLDSVHEGYFEVDLTGKFTFFNDWLLGISKIQKGELLTVDNRNYMPAETAKKIFYHFNEIYTTGNSIQNIEIDIINGDGEHKAHELSASLIRGKNGEPIGFRGLTRDTTEQKINRELEKQLQKSNKMEAVGTLASGIAHNFNNTMMSIQGHATLLLMEKTSSDPDYEDLKAIEDNVNIASEMTKDLLDFVRSGEFEAKHTNLNLLIKYENEMFGRTRKEIIFHEEFTKNIWTVEVDHGQIRQVLINIFTNAQQAMQNGGKIFVQTENITFEEKQINSESVITDPGNYVKIAITDTGPGISPDIRDKIFNPFFTTKETGQGTGLGLSSAYGIIKKHRGFIDTDIDNSKGATFNIFLPAVNTESIIEEEASQPEENRLRKGEGTVLLVDDEDIITKVGSRMIEKLGYDVLIATSGEEAVEIYKKEYSSIIMVVLDMVMPGMDGGTVFNLLKDINPEIIVLLSSGYGLNSRTQEIVDRGCSGFIQKPFSMHNLSQLMNKMLHKN